MCIARVGRVISLSGSKAKVEFFDGKVVDEIDVSMISVKQGSYIEVFANLALRSLNKSEAESRRKAWLIINSKVR